MRHSTRQYRSYLLRCWSEPAQHSKLPRVWRFSLEDPRTGKLHGFATLEALMDFVHRATVTEPTDRQEDEA